MWSASSSFKRSGKSLQISDDSHLKPGAFSSSNIFETFQMQARMMNKSSFPLMTYDSKIFDTFQVPGKKVRPVPGKNGDCSITKESLGNQSGSRQDPNSGKNLQSRMETHWRQGTVPLKHNKVLKQNTSSIDSLFQAEHVSFKSDSDLTKTK